MSLSREPGPEPEPLQSGSASTIVKVGSEAGSSLESFSNADNLQTAFWWPGQDIPCPRVRGQGSELLEPGAAGPQRMAGQARLGVVAAVAMPLLAFYLRRVLVVLLRRHRTWCAHGPQAIRI